MVLVAHGFFIGYGIAPIMHFSQGEVDLGAIAVHGFFVISGYLVSQSWFRLRNVNAYLNRRALRLFPGYWLCLGLTALVFAPLCWFLEYGKLDGYLGANPSAFQYFWQNSGLLQYQRTIGNLSNNQLVPGYLNSSLWTLPYEFFCYLGLIGIAFIGGIKKRSYWLIFIFFAFYLNYTLDPTHYRWLTRLYSTPAAVRLPIYFAAGAVWWSWEECLKISKFHCAVLAAVALFATGLGSYHLVMPFLLVAIVMPLAGFIRTPTWLQPRDYSYGVYLYATLIERAMVAAGWTMLNPWMFCLVAGLLTLPIAALSWHLCEHPCLKLRSGRPKNIVDFSH